MHSGRYCPAIALDHPSAEIEADTKTVHLYPVQSIVPIANRCTNYNLRAKSFAEQQAVLSLRQLSQRRDSESNISGDGIAELTNALITDAPPEVAQAVQRDELAALTNLQSLIQKRLAIVLQGRSAPALNGTGVSEAPIAVDDSMDGIS
jgi:hypothetical protein